MSAGVSEFVLINVHVQPYFDNVGVAPADYRLFAASTAVFELTFLYGFLLRHCPVQQGMTLRLKIVEDKRSEDTGFQPNNFLQPTTFTQRGFAQGCPCVHE